MRKFLSLLGVLTISAGFAVQGAESEETTNQYSVVARYPHDTQAFTQGLIFEDGYLYESTGSPRFMDTISDVRQVDLASGVVLKSTSLSDAHFGEGMTSIGDELVSITYKARRTYRWDKLTLQQKPRLSNSRHDYRGEGWGLTYDGKYLIMSNGSSKLQFFNSDTFKPTKNSFGKKKLTVRYNGAKVSNINELEYVEGKIFANIWQEPKIAIINPETGVVENWLDLSAIVNEVGAPHPEAVLNGIAYNKDTGRLFVTGKLWPYVYEIESNLIPDH